MPTATENCITQHTPRKLSADFRVQVSEASLGIAARFVRQHWLAVSSISLFLLIPCFWQRYIVAGDLDSHMYNAWLVQLIKQGRAPGLWISRQWENVLFDLILSSLGTLFGLHAAERIAIPICVLLFFWGTFSFIAAATRRAPWFLVPCIAMLAYGWTFQMGFFNYYLSLGLSFFALSIFWRGLPIERLLILALVPAIWAAHPLGLVWLVGAAAYIGVAQRLSWRGQVLLLAVAGTILAIISTFVYFRFFVEWEPILGIGANGADQFSLILAGRANPSWLWLAFAVACLSVDIFIRRREPRIWNQYGLPLQLYLAAIIGVSLVPDAVSVPTFGLPISFITHRLSSISAVLAFCVLGVMKPRKWHVIGYTGIAIIFFSYLYKSHVEMVRMEAQAEQLVSSLPPGQRVTPDLWRGSILSELSNHVVDRACIGKCFSYSNYEPSFKQFRVRAAPGNPIVTSNPVDSLSLQWGEYIPRIDELPIYQIYQCAREPNRLCMRELHAATKARDQGAITPTGDHGHSGTLP